jgi:site-specific DNA-cytosine methylase
VDLSDYELSFGHLNAADYGVAQRRVRTIVIGSRIGQIDLPRPTHARVPGEAGLLGWVGTSSRISGLPERPTTTALPTKYLRVLRRDRSRDIQRYGPSHRAQSDRSVPGAIRPHSSRPRPVRCS